ncbi:uncharacterized protein L969DRAFT_17138 [Mixia osmundae IAM 14324]|uniref:J domain-containing protein n=1 Tax=Mixia osmundae (strain CBS 9802 / IAM 14324 / JCM 22182 / KY 12970) TaxID=764103 RepID=G7E8E1_MIXOS|nr:uncharacterized protein L969DRAFT_17138 [Mixia osmundae IAM 14324]KEI39204.1 hypothetical protein L969DRAFT_17138 [Mixia osmundae IAM 14324]GAA99101.1 hypothetical protein E5Q_05790 [Mixia osmundae IAM 14324]
MSGFGSSAASTWLMPLVIILSWQFLPSLATRILLAVFYRVQPSARPIIQRTDSVESVAIKQKRAELHYKIAAGVVIGGYLLYTVVQAYRKTLLTGNFYSDLGVARPWEKAEFDENELRVKWRRLARVYHPDKSQASAGPEDQAARDALFLRMRGAYEVLASEKQRRAYTRFGSDLIASCGNRCSTDRDYILAYVNQSLVYYIMFLVLMLVFTFGGPKGSQGSFYWRIVGLLSLMSFEYSLILAPINVSLSVSKQSLVNRMFTAAPSALRLLTFEAVSVFRQFFISFSCAVTQLGPLLSAELAAPVPLPKTVAEMNDFIKAEVRAVEPALKHLDELTSYGRQRSLNALAGQLSVLAQADLLEQRSDLLSQGTTDGIAKKDVILSSDQFEMLSKRMIDMLCEQRLRTTPEGAQAWQDVIIKHAEQTKPSLGNQHVADNGPKIARLPTVDSKLTRDSQSVLDSKPVIKLEEEVATVAVPLRTSDSKTFKGE